MPTLRVWESRYAAFSPRKSEGKHRLYSDDDVLRASLLRQLTESGHAISTIARLDASRLGGLLHKQRMARPAHATQGRGAQSVAVAVVGLPLAARIQSVRFGLSFSAHALRVSQVLRDLPEAADQHFREMPDILLVRVNSLHAVVQQALQRIIDREGIARVIVLYSFGQEQLVQALRLSGMIVRREPISDTELADLIDSVLLVDPGMSRQSMPPGAMIPARRYSDQTLARVAAIPSRVLCECPRHVAELIAQLASFEQYSQECLHTSAQDAHLHAYLSAVSGSARALFERALEMVAQHEGITLESSAEPLAMDKQP